MKKNFDAWPKHWPKSQNYLEIPVHYFLDNTAARVPNRIAIVFGGMELTYGELRELSCRFASALLDFGIKKGDRIAINLPNCPQFAIAYYGLLRIGAVFTPLSPLLSQKEIQHQLANSGAKLVVTLDLLALTIKPVLKETEVSQVITTSIADCYSRLIAPLKPLEKVETDGAEDMADLLKKNAPYDQEATLNLSEDLAHIAYTGGTTGVSKGVMLSHANVATNVFQYGHWANGSYSEINDGVISSVFPEEITPEERNTLTDQETALVVVPWFHAMGTIGYLNVLVFGGVTMIVFPRFDPTEYLESVKKYKATVLGGAPQLYMPLINHPDFFDYDLSTIKAATSGAAPLPIAVIGTLTKAFSEGYVTEGYGLTECTMGAMVNLPGQGKSRNGSVGLPIYDTEVKIIDPNSLKRLPIGEEGEICIKGPQIMKGYWKRPEATAEVLVDGWLRTGDIGKEDEDGFFYITDRLKDLILYKGYNVYPRELEEALYQHEAVEQCAVIGKQDPNAGEIPIAFVKLKNEDNVSEKIIIEFVNSQVAAYKKLRGVIFSDNIPVSGAGKILKRELRERLI